MISKLISSHKKANKLKVTRSHSFQQTAQSKFTLVQRMKLVTTSILQKMVSTMHVLKIHHMISVSQLHKSTSKSSVIPATHSLQLQMKTAKLTSSQVLIISSVIRVVTTTSQKLNLI